MSCGSVGSAVRGFRLVNRQSAYGLRPTARELRPTARELRPKQPGVGRTQDKRPQGSQQAPSCMTSIRRWPGIATCLTIIRPFPAKLVPEGGLDGYVSSCPPPKKSASFGRMPDLLFDHPAEGSDAERLRERRRDPPASGVVRTTEQPNSEAVCVEVHSTRLAELAKACGAALLSSFR